MKATVHVTKALSDGSRLRVIAALAEHAQLCVCQLTEMLQLATPTVSRHMSVLQNARLVHSRRDGRWVFYRISDSFPPLLLQWIRSSLTESEEIAKDRENLKSILACELRDLCRNQKRRRPRNQKPPCAHCAAKGQGRLNCPGSPTLEKRPGKLPNHDHF